MGMFLAKWVVFGCVAWLIWDAGYKRGKGDLWEFLARNYIVLPKGSYYCCSPKNKQNRGTKKYENRKKYTK
ncbi:MAG: hypothetical protein J6S67_25430 [Methanobrevibacter sp.]|nr:hypothetical protein [Methanobrevibacter sp.]